MFKMQKWVRVGKLVKMECPQNGGKKYTWLTDGNLSAKSNWGAPKEFCHQVRFGNRDSLHWIGCCESGGKWCFPTGIPLKLKMIGKSNSHSQKIRAGI